MLNDERTLMERTRRITPALHQEVRQHLKEMLDHGVIRESQSPFASNIVLVRKKYDSLRFCIDFRILNAASIQDSFPLPRIEETLDGLGVKLKEEDKQKTAFTVGLLGLF